MTTPRQGAQDSDYASLRAQLHEKTALIAAMGRDALLLREANEQLLIASVDAQNLRDAAETANTRQNAFLTKLAHELRNPLAPISMANAMLATLPAASPDLLKLQGVIARQVAQLTRLLDELLAAAGCGSVVSESLALPLPPQAGPASGQAAAPAVPRRILVVEDNLDANDTLGRLLMAEGHHVTAAYDGFEGLALARKQVFDVMLCDIGLPGLDGLELIARLRATTGAHIPFAIAVSGYAQAEDRMRAVAAGYGQYFVKPVDVNALLGLISSEAVSSFIAAAPKPR